MNENWKPETWGPQDIEFQGHQYRYSRGHATAELLDAIAGIAPSLSKSRCVFGPSPADMALRCGETFSYAGTVFAIDPRPEVTCPRCRALMRAIRPASAPLHEIREGCYFVGGEQVSLAEYNERLMRLSPYSADGIERVQRSSEKVKLFLDKHKEQP